MNIAVIKHFRNDTFAEINITTTEVVFIQLLSYNVVSKQKKNKNENAECHGIFIPLKSHLNSKQGSLIFLLKTVNEFCVSNGAKWLSIRLWKKWLWNDSCCSYLNFRYRACFKQGASWYSDNCRVYIHSKTWMWHDKKN